MLTGRWEDPNADPVAAPAPKPSEPANEAKETPAPAPEKAEKHEEPQAPTPEPPAPVAEVKKPDPFDGCTKSDGTLSIYMGIGVQFPKKTCNLERNIDEYEATLTQGKLVIQVKSISKPPDIAKVRAGADKLRKVAADNNARVDISIAGDATYTLVSMRATKSTGEVVGIVESVRIIGDEYFRCQAKLEGPDTALLPVAKQICASMRAMKEK